MNNQLKSPFLESVRELIRLKHLSYRTEEAYLGWIRRFIIFHDKRHPKEMGAAEVKEFLTHPHRDFGAILQRFHLEWHIRELKELPPNSRLLLPHVR